MLLGLLAAVLILAFLIVAHEFGHFIVAKRLGVGVLKFSVGFGPKLLGRVVNGTEYALSAVPLGGYVKMVGEDPDAAEEADPRISFSHQRLWTRTAIVAAGPIFNLLLAFVAFTVIAMIYGVPVPNESSKIGGVLDGTPAAQVGIQAGDVVTQVDGRPISTWKDLSSAIRGSEGREVELTVQRGSDTLAIHVRAEERPEKNIFGEVIGSAFLIGIGPASDREHVGPLQAVTDGMNETWFWTKTTLLSVVKLVQGKISREDIGGPILIMQAATQQAQVGLENLLHFMALISINLGILNLLPIPVLDGGHLLFFVVEAVIRRPLDIRHREIAQQIGLVILVALMLFAFYNDISRVLQGWG